MLGSQAAALRVVIFTQGGLGIPISAGVAALGGVTLAGIYQELPPPKRRSAAERVRRNVRYFGYLGATTRAVRRAARRLRPTSPDRGVDDGATLEMIAKNRGAVFQGVTDLHSPDTRLSIQSLRPDLGVLVGTTIVNPTLFEIPRLGTINLHQGKVPEYRGSAPVYWALRENATEYGVTIHRVVERVDAGPVILSTLVPFNYDYDAYRLDYERFIENFEASLADVSVELMVDAVRRIAEGRYVFTQQDEARAVRRRMPTYVEKQQLRKLLSQRHGKKVVR